MKILCVHPNFELYGSDRWFASAMEVLVRAYGAGSVRIILPRNGPIETLEPFGRVEVLLSSMLIPRRKKILRTLLKIIIKCPAQLWHALSEMNGVCVTYVNTIIALDFLLMARFSRQPVIVHVHEIPTGMELRIFRQLLIFSRAFLIFNSIATREAFYLPRGRKSMVVYNGFVDPGIKEKQLYERTRKLRILVIGRINQWKGHEIVVAACEKLPSELRGEIEVRFVGGVFEGFTNLQNALKRRIAQANLSDVIRISPFEADPADSYLAADIVIVPSRLPEPFGRVAIEAMAYGCVVIASNHGGLPEIVVDGETGVLVPPGDAESMAAAISKLLKTPELIHSMAKAARQRFVENFTQEASDVAFLEAIGRVLGDTGERQPN